MLEAGTSKRTTYSSSDSVEFFIEIMWLPSCDDIPIEPPIWIPLLRASDHTIPWIQCFCRRHTNTAHLRKVDKRPLTLVVNGTV